MSFISPVAQLLMGKKVGALVVLKLADENRVFNVIAIAYK
ncbi:GreA/GreB family elongation factor [Mariniflexile ostreae]|uniref:GreA/GreB family elongation factor n=1 Tax=Mariniflexile ostreae TaxID=1520892 RepID=A0ABV5FFM2_9FLAO